MTSRVLHLAKDLTLPLSVVTESVGILAKRRAGKSTTARRLTEQLHKVKQQVVVVDPKGDWWGLLFARDGKNPGLPFIVLGGEHGHAPLEAGAGEVVARLVVEERVSLILDLGRFRKHEVATFMTAFMETVYRLKAQEQYRTPLMLVIDEADAVAPQRPMRGEERMLGAVEDLVRRGGQRGIGVVMLTQRAAVLNKNVLTQIGILIVLRTIAPQDLAAMDAWIDVHGTVEQRKELMASLPSLPQGTGWVWAPGWPDADGIFSKHAFQLPETFDSSATPTEKKPIEPKNAADVDLEALKRQMAATIEKAKADDPRELRKQIAELKKALDNKKYSAVGIQNIPAPKRVEVLKDGQLIRAERLVAQIDGQIKGFHDRLEKLADAVNLKTEPPLVKLRLVAEHITAAIEKTRQLMPHQEAERTTPVRRQERLAGAGSPGGSRDRARPATNGGDPLGKCERAILTVLSQYGDGCTAGKLTLLTRYRYSGGFKNSLSTLRQAEFVVGENTATMAITAAGRAALGYVEPLPTGGDLAQYWLAHRSFGKCEQAILATLLDHPKGLTADQLCERTTYQYSGGFKNALSNLRTAGVLVGKNTDVMRASEELFS
jgi:hypothetical protein